MQDIKNSVAIVTDYAAPYRGNFFQSILALEKIINKNGKMIFIFPKKAKELKWVIELQSEEREVYFLDEAIQKKNRELNKILKKEDVDIVHSHFCLPKTQLIVKKCCVMHNLKLIQHYHNHYDLLGKDPKTKLLRWANKGNLNIACSQSVNESIPYKNKVCVTNAIKFSRLDQYDDKFQFFREDANSKVFLMLGFDYKRKGVDLAIRALQPLASKYSFTLKVVVSVKQKNVEELIQKDFGTIPDWVEVIPPREDIATYYNAADVFLQTAREEGFCYALVEAAYCGLSCISSNIDGVPKDIPSVESFEINDISSLTRKCENVIKNPKSSEEREYMRTYTMETYAMDNWVDGIMECYSSFYQN